MNSSGFVFIIQGEGRGHLTQALRMKQIIEKAGHQVSAVCYGASPQNPVPPELNENFGKKVRIFNSPQFIRKKNRRGISVFRSLVYNLLRSPLYFRSIGILKRLMDFPETGGIINFYEMTAGIAYRFSKQKAPLYCISHHFMFEMPDFPKPMGFILQKALLKLHNRIVAPKEARKLALSFYFADDRGDHSVIPPFIRSDILNCKTHRENFILIYLLSEGLLMRLLPVIENHPEIKFKLYSTFSPDKTEYPPNLSFHSPEYSAFGNELAECMGLIATSGFESVCEAAYLGKPVFLIPSEGHYEQAGNLRDAIGAGLALPVEEFSVDKLKSISNSDFRNWCRTLSIRLHENLKL